ncbi:MAG TPA: hypothetical protein VGI12_18295 [Vicinamibacterales bacterium]|jgi:hypothetical protein
MRGIRTGITDIDEYLEAGVRAKQDLDADRWRREIRPRELRLFAARARHLTWSRALLKAVVEELYPDDLFADLVGTLDCIPRRQWPWVLASAVALRQSWRRDGLTRLAQSLRVSLPPSGSDPHGSSVHPSRPSPPRVYGSPRRRQGAPRCGAPAKRGLRP